MPNTKKPIPSQTIQLIKDSSIPGKGRKRRKELLELTGLSVGVFNRIIREEGLNPDLYCQGKLTPQEKEEIIKRKEKTKDSNQTIADDYAVSRDKIDKLINENNGGVSRIMKKSEEDYEPYSNSKDIDNNPLAIGSTTRNGVYRIDSLIPTDDFSPSKTANFTCNHCGTKKLNWSIYSAQDLKVSACESCPEDPPGSIIGEYNWVYLGKSDIRKRDGKKQVRVRCPRCLEEVIKPRFDIVRTDGKALQSCGCATPHLISEARKRMAVMDSSKDSRYQELYYCWRSMIWRCYSESVDYITKRTYQEKGISVHNAWNIPRDRINSYLSFKSWAESSGWKPGLQIDRIDYDGDYEPSNCRWVNAKIQQQNKSNNQWWTYCGLVYSQNDLTKYLGLGKDFLSDFATGKKKSLKIEGDIKHFGKGKEAKREATEYCIKISF